MKFDQKRTIPRREKFSVGGMDKMPPTLCPCPAHVAAYSEVTGSPRMNEWMGVWPAEQAMIFPREALP